MRGTIGCGDVLGIVLVACVRGRLAATLLIRTDLRTPGNRMRKITSRRSGGWIPGRKTNGHCDPKVLAKREQGETQAEATGDKQTARLM
jgi:hypothetical protein